MGTFVWSSYSMPQRFAPFVCFWKEKPKALIKPQQFKYLGTKWGLLNVKCAHQTESHILPLIILLSKSVDIFPLCGTIALSQNPVDWYDWNWNILTCQRCYNNEIEMAMSSNIYDYRYYKNTILLYWYMKCGSHSLLTPWPFSSWKMVHLPLVVYAVAISNSPQYLTFYACLEIQVAQLRWASLMCYVLLAVCFSMFPWFPTFYDLKVISIMVTSLFFIHWNWLKRTFYHSKISHKSLGLAYLWLKCSWIVIIHHLARCIWFNFPWCQECLPYSLCS